MSLLLHQGGGRARAYHVLPATARARYAGRDGSHRFLGDLAESPALSSVLRRARPAGPCATVLNTQTWTQSPAAGSVVLIGDAAGRSDPAIGCGLSVAMRDARTIRDLVLAGAAHAPDFAAYAAERAERMRRLRLIAEVMITAVVQPGPDRSERRARFAHAMATFDPAVFPLVLGMFTGPESVPEPLVDAGVPSVLRAA
jgi:2-polyprenyl-6-methoxyphenol hydroxylase-like FAD-dependent oxidoreductase